MYSQWYEWDDICLSRNLFHRCQMGSLFISQTIVVSVICKHLFEFNFVCLYTYEFWLCKIVRSSVILLLHLFVILIHYTSSFFKIKCLAVRPIWL
jgi:hypothetical protein